MRRRITDTQAAALPSMLNAVAHCGAWRLKPQLETFESSGRLYGQRIKASVQFDTSGQSWTATIAFSRDTFSAAAADPVEAYREAVRRSGAVYVGGVAAR